MKRFLVSATSAAVLSMLSSGAFAAVNLDDGTTPAKYAKELVTAGTTALAGGVIDVKSTLGFGVSDGQTRFVRYDLTNGKFKANVATADLTFSGAPTAPAVTVSQGGMAGDTYVIFQITAGTGGLAQTQEVDFASGAAAKGIVIQSAASPVQMAYSLYADASAAAAGGSVGRLNTNYAAQTVASLVSGVAFSTTQTTSTVSVASSPTYTHFLVGGTGTSVDVAQIGTVSIGAATSVYTPAGAAVAYTDLVAAGTKLVLNGDFGAAASPSDGTVPKGVYLSAGADCSVAGMTPTPATPTTSASFATGLTPQTNAPLCFSVTAANAVKIAAQTFTVQANITPATGSTTANIAPIDAGKFERDGLVLKAAFAETTGVSGVSRSVSLSNTSGNDAPYTVRCLVNSVAVNGISGTVPANSSTRQSLGTPGLGCPTNGTMRGIEITFAVTPGSVIGSMVSQSLSTGQASYDAMTGNK